MVSELDENLETGLPTLSPITTLCLCFGALASANCRLVTSGFNVLHAIAAWKNSLILCGRSPWLGARGTFSSKNTRTKFFRNCISTASFIPRPRWIPAH
ncbi:hypothetical protein Hypma_000567 [Hypsizygus marmoreus]|uniref:Uncharacterized protein n=1 Tax=Hypsizygus marmoreus TaxID=39966 RepID=A0A369JC29_HYPMA|nr:hypothetical protein Hypma_000567 [Hypsizygus marmoreus]